MTANLATADKSAAQLNKVNFIQKLRSVCTTIQTYH